MINLGDDIIDSRDIIARMEELESEIGDLETDLEDLTNEHDNLDAIQGEIAALQDEIDDLEDELEMWKLFEGVGVADWLHGEAFINEDYFPKYAMQLADDIGAVNTDAGWPNNHIDWDAAADDLKQDYTEVEVEDYTYWARA